MNKHIKNLALVAIVLSGLGFAQAQAASVSVNIGRGGVSVAVSDCNHKAGKCMARVKHDLRDRRHVDRCRMCKDALRRDMERREMARREAERRQHAFARNLRRR